MASTEKEIDSLIRIKSYGSRDAVISDAVRALLVLKPGLKMEVALDLYKNGEVSLWRAAEIAGLCLEEFKELLASRSIRIEVGTSNEESLERLRKQACYENSHP
jgi:predicted HTH domain antitoxin